ncbi:hypothetical protein DC094_07235 [Pelagibaculum spongiae]|uniref:YHS domain protein n=1 Tax=Pelagibaculum spongiae TaxID=2080658 RepID=A0A2V1H0F6_9GAMM|nr:hypothetical protein DC094_07235 [Pelagibaculum spongiae]
MRSLSALSLLLVSLSLQAEPVSKSFFGGVAIGGHDTVAYHQLAKAGKPKAIEGNDRFSVKWKGANWHFISKADAQKFSDNPEAFSPAYNGFCANALSLGEGLVKTDGSHWKIFEDQLYLFYADRGRQRWVNGNWQTYKVEADQAWQVLSK